MAVTEARISALEGLVRNLLTRVGSSSGVTSFNSRTGAVVPATNDYTWAQVDKTTSNITDITTKNVEDLTYSDNTTNDASTTKHGLLRKLDNNTSNFLRGDGAWAAPTGGNNFILFATGGNPIGADGTNVNFALAGYNGIGATENDRQTIAPVACTLQKFYVRVTANTYGSNSTFTIRKNEASTSIVATVTASTTGTFSDTSNTAAVAAGDRLGVLFAGGATVTYNGTACYGAV